jgi:SpoIID/LytB domain protein
VINLEREPTIKVGLMSAETAPLVLSGPFSAEQRGSLPDGEYQASLAGGEVELVGPASVRAPAIRLSPLDSDECRFTLHDVTIGVDFHWQRREIQTFQGALHIIAIPTGVALINELPLESYLVSVISSEMSASCPPALLRAHAIVSRSWLLSQLLERKQPIVTRRVLELTPGGSTDEIIRWYNRESHEQFDVCADDHCQRYQGITKASSTSVFEAARETRGVVLVFDQGICDARYSKSCGGMTEVYSAAWEDRDVPYLQSVYDGPGPPAGVAMPLSIEQNAQAWIRSSPAAYCNTDSPELLARILPGYDQETRDFFRWKITYSQEELSELVRERTGRDLGRVIALEPLARGESGRITRLSIKGEKASLVLGKELEIRRALSRSHLYSSAFVVNVSRDGGFDITGAGWGHGVGLCQIGAAVMAEQGFDHGQILRHYFTGVQTSRLYA